MHYYIVFAHPSKKSFTFKVLQSFIDGISKSGHTFEVGDLYAMDFKCDMNIEQYERETGLDPVATVPNDITIEQTKVQQSDVLVFVYPVWWSDCPAKLKGWFDRVWSFGFAYYYDKDYQRKSLIIPKKAIVLCTAGSTNYDLEATGISESMRRIMIIDRLNNVGIADVQMEIYGGTLNATHEYLNKHLESAYNIGFRAT